MHARALVAAVLRPHDRENAELGQRSARGRARGRCARIRRGVRPCRSRTCWSMPCANTPRSNRHADDAERPALAAPAACTTDSNSTRPSALPSTASHARSGCGIRPTTLRAFVADAGDVVQRAVRVGRVGDLAARVAVAEDRRGRDASSSRDDLRLGVVVPFAVRDRHPQHAGPGRTPRERRVGLLDADDDVLAVEPQVAVAQHRAGQQPGLEQHLEAVADAEHRPAAPRELAHRRHDRREPRDRAGAQVVAVGEAAGQDDDVGALQVGVLVPDELGVLAEHVLGGVIGVVVAVRAGKDDDAEFHHRPVPGSLARLLHSTCSSRSTGFASTLSATSAASARACSADAAPQLELEELSLAHVADARVAERMQRVGDRLAPAGSNTDGFNVTKTRAFMLAPCRLRPASRSSSLRTTPRHAAAPAHGVNTRVEDRVHVAQLIVEVERLLDLRRRQHRHHVASPRAAAP